MQSTLLYISSPSVVIIPYLLCGYLSCELEVWEGGPWGGGGGGCSVLFLAGHSFVAEWALRRGCRYLCYCILFPAELSTADAWPVVDEETRFSTPLLAAHTFYVRARRLGMQNVCCIQRVEEKSEDNDGSKNANAKYMAWD